MNDKTPILQGTCGNCRFAVSATDKDGKINWHQRFCRWGPPTPIIVGMGPQGPIMNCFWPTMGSNMVCGRHEYRDAGERLPGDHKPGVADEELKPS